MKKILYVFILFVGVTGIINAQEIRLWPEIQPYKTGYLKVSDLHQVYYELSGNPDGKPVFVVHGGPGGGTSPFMRRFFNPRKFNIISNKRIPLIIVGKLLLFGVNSIVISTNS